MTAVSSRKVGIVGAGMVGSSFAYALLQRGVASEIVLVDQDAGRAEGEAMDLAHGLPFVAATDVRAGGFPDLAGSAVVVVTAGANQKPGQTRLDLLQGNAAICRDVVPRIVAANPHGVLVLASNPVDVLTHIAAEAAGLPWGRVIGSGTILDTARLRYLVGAHLGVDTHSVHAYVVAEHGDSAVPVWSGASLGGLALDQAARARGCPWDDGVRAAIFEGTRTAAYEIVKRKRATYYAIGLALRVLVEAVLRDQQTVLTVSAPVRGTYGVTGMSLSLPAIVGRAGVAGILELPLDDAERAGFVASASALKERLAAV
jgi:L-lactate dehydrogenase